jgi:hypothetical protein
MTMPLIPGSGRATIGANIAELIRSGRDPRQAAAIAYRTAKEKPKQQKKKR